MIGLGILESKKVEVSAENLASSIGRQEICFDDITPTQARGLAAILDWKDTQQISGDILPAPWHWLYFLPTPKSSEIDIDGHPKRGGFLPLISLPRRMWAGSRINFIAPICIGDSTRRLSTIKDIKIKNGKSGQLVIVTVLHEIYVINNKDNAEANSECLAISEEQDIVYRDAAPSAAANASPSPKPAPVPAKPQWSDTINVDAVMLFRYSALTFNGHRIHYDYKYAVEEEGYGGLVVHGPLTATLLLDLLRKKLPNESVKTFSFRGIRPITDTGPLKIEGRQEGRVVLLWALDCSGALAMDAQATLI